MDIERHLNNRPLTYVECESEAQVLTPNVIMLGGNAYPFEETKENTACKCETKCLATLKKGVCSRFDGGS